MATDVYNSLFIQILLFALLATVLLVSVISLFIKPAKRTIRASLVDASNGHIIDISQFETSIGRAKTCDISIDNITVSRFHAVLSRRANGWILFDTNSTSGTFVNGGAIKKNQLLKDGDHINFGKCEFVFYSTAVTTRQQVVHKAKNNSVPRTPRKASNAPARTRAATSPSKNRKTTTNKEK